MIPMTLASAGCAMSASAPSDGSAANESTDSASAALHAHEPRGAVYTITNAAGRNELVAFDRAHDGSLSAAGMFATGGAGSGDGLGSQGALARAGEWLFVVNAGSNDISTFSLRGASPELVARTPSGGDRPVSLTASDRILYVVNAGANQGISGFWIKDDGSLAPIEGATQPLSAASAGAAEIAFAPDGDTLVVTEKATSRIDTYWVDPRGRAHGPVVTASSGMTPFGFDFTPRGELVVSEAQGGGAGKSTVSGYRIFAEVGLDTVSASIPDTQTAACWIALGEGGKYAFTTNAGSGTVSSYAVGHGGALTLSEAIAGDAGAKSHPTDMGVSRGGRYLYVLAGGIGAIEAFAIEGGQLTRVDSPASMNAGLPGTSARIVAY
jgi:6-phosphogluconolactonase (cycloisomerase 2 family)